MSRLFLEKDIFRMRVDRTGSKLSQIGGFVISDFELRNLFEYNNSYVCRVEIYFNPGGAKLLYVLISEGKINFQANT